MRYLSLFFLLFAMWGSWAVLHCPVDIPEEVHLGIQAGLQERIAEQIQKTLPNMKDLRFEKMWTETLGAEKVKASFLYSFDDNNEKTGPTRIQIEGYAVLNKDPKSSDVEEVWNFDRLQILNNGIEFKDPLVIKAHETDGP